MRTQSVDRGDVIANSQPPDVVGTESVNDESRLVRPPSVDAGFAHAGLACDAFDGEIAQRERMHALAAVQAAHRRTQNRLAASLIPLRHATTLKVTDGAS